MPEETLEDLRARNAALEEVVKELCGLTQDHFYPYDAEVGFRGCIECGELLIHVAKRGHAKDCKYGATYKKSEDLIGGP